jgi:hypothetical protein
MQKQMDRKSLVETWCARTDKARASTQDEKTVDRADLYVLLRLLSISTT